VAVDGPQIDRPACPAGQKTSSPRRPSDQCGPDRRRPQRVAASGHSSIPAVDDELCLEQLALGTMSVAAKLISNAGSLVGTMGFPPCAWGGSADGHFAARPVSTREAGSIAIGAPAPELWIGSKGTPCGESSARNWGSLPVMCVPREGRITAASIFRRCSTWSVSCLPLASASVIYRSIVLSLA
jgi:hypothetical protein